VDVLGPATKPEIRVLALLTTENKSTTATNHSVYTWRRRLGDEAGETASVVTALATAEAATVVVRPAVDVTRWRHGGGTRRRSVGDGRASRLIVVDLCASSARRRLLALPLVTGKR